MNEGRDELGGIGTATAALAISGHPQSTENELWNGSSWTEVGDLNTGRHAHGAAGTSTAGIIFGGNSGTADAKTETWNGSAWTETNDLSTARAAGGSAMQVQMKLVFILEAHQLKLQLKNLVL